MPWFGSTVATIPIWISTNCTSATTCAPTWAWAYNCPSATTTTGNSIVWASNQNQTYSACQNQLSNGLLSQMYAAQAQAAYERYQFQPYQPTGLRWQSAAPALITHQEQARRDQELYRRALAEHDDQEAGRLLRQIEARELAAADRQRLLEQQMQQHRDEQGRREAASTRARELLLEHLTPHQRETYVKNGWFVVEGGRTKTKYRIRGGTLVANIDVLDRRDRSTHRLCGHAQSHIPMGDQLLSQKIMLELAEDEFLRLANRHAA